MELNQFAQFDNAKMGSQTDSGECMVRGFYHTQSKNQQKHYAGEKGYIKEVYADMKKTLMLLTHKADIPDIKSTK